MWLSWYFSHNDCSQESFLRNSFSISDSVTITNGSFSSSDPGVDSLRGDDGIEAGVDDEEEDEEAK